ncbi:MAG TPA: dTDP-4-dehydrorhamnose 3,5-epimerase family protein [Bauldia sp.]|nr:dTDP-4-dehydrorhamnose 3,5-epimerase family protein [Bauldia sp.]
MIDGVFVRDLSVHADARGTLTELFREDWGGLPLPRQWNLVRTAPNTLRGVHVHRAHDDYLIVLDGSMHLGLHDLRADSPTSGRSDLILLDGTVMRAAFVPRGVMHGFCFTEPSVYVYGLTACWSPADDLGCHWSDPDLGIPWPVTEPVVSDRDRDAPSLALFKASLADVSFR